MQTSLRKIVILSLVGAGACLPGLALSAGMACQVRRNAAEAVESSSQPGTDDAASIAALTKMGVPLQRDANGRVRWIEAVKGELSDRAMHHLPGLPLLEWLEIGHGNVTALGMSRLQGCASIRRLYVHDVPLGNDPLAWLSHLTRLEALSLQRLGITGRVLRNLKAAETLSVLNLSDSNVTDADLAEVARLKGLEVLALKNTKITGAGLAHLKGMAKLNVMNLADCAVGDADLEPFMSMPNLRIVYAVGSKISEAAVKDYGQKLPMLSIFR
jgi:hypothetical protein